MVLGQNYKMVTLVMVNIQESEDEICVFDDDNDKSVPTRVGQPGHKQEQTIVIARHHPPSPPTPLKNFRDDDHGEDDEGEEGDVVGGDDDYDDGND